jgi:hypothetical protein
VREIIYAPLFIVKKILDEDKMRGNQGRRNFHTPGDSLDGISLAYPGKANEV